MLKIHPGLKALAILIGPASLIIGHQKLSDYLSPPDSYDAELAEVLQDIYQDCSEPPKLQRTVQCDEYVKYVDGCIASKNCDPRSSYELLIKLDFSPPPLRPSPINKAAVTRVTDS